jgi:hypothetical protein
VPPRLALALARAAAMRCSDRPRSLLGGTNCCWAEMTWSTRIATLTSFENRVTHLPAMSRVSNDRLTLTGRERLS